MSPDMYAAGLAFTLVCGLLGIIWKQLNSRLDKRDEDEAAAIASIKKAFADEVQLLDVRLNAKLTDRLGDHSSRLSNGSLRMDSLLTEISNLKVKLAEDYHSAPEVRTLIADMTLPITQQLNRMENDLRYLANYKQRGEA